jgi:hypothetical protein
MAPRTKIESKKGPGGSSGAPGPALLLDHPESVGERAGRKSRNDGIRLFRERFFRSALMFAMKRPFA